jgi:acyl transferase domain-containing protein/NADP-dependent 3-hydroxy acid dehydrogenase YdfG
MRFDLENLLKRLEGGEIDVENAILELERFVDVSPDSLSPRNNLAPEVKHSADSETAGAPKVELATKYLRNIISRVCGISPEAIDPKAPFERFGIDSMLIARLNRILEEDFGQLSKTLFFEYQTVADLASFFALHHGEKISSIHGETRAQSVAADAPVVGVSQRPGESAEIEFVARDFPLRQSESASLAADEPVAVIGIAGRFPMAENLDAFWENLKSGKDCITEDSGERWGNQNRADRRGGNSSGPPVWGGFLEGADSFDARFFKISPREAELMDPQERLFLETAWETLEDAGYTRATLPRLSAKHPGGKVGVFVGVMYGHYQLYAAEEMQKGNPVAPLSAYWAIANRVSHFFNLSGPSMAVDTACSSSLSAIHLACESLRRGECKMALAGGVNLTVHPVKNLILSQGKFSSSDGRCRSFGEGGDGYVPGEGVGAVLLKPLREAIRDKDNIHGIIRASAVNHGGKTNGFMVPNPNAQEEVIAEALARAGVSADSISYVEAHGTGTALGDPIEVTGLAGAFSVTSKRKQFCALGSVKSNIGHLESAAGIAALAKVLLQMKHRSLVPTLHCERVNANIVLDTGPFYLQRTFSKWERPAIPGEKVLPPRRAGISSFGAGGANAHVVVEEYAPLDSQAASGTNGNGHHPKVFIVPLSAKSRPALVASAARLADFLGNGVHSLASVAFTLQTGREAFSERVAFLASTTAELAQDLAAFAKGNPLSERVFVPASENGDLSKILGDGEETKTLIDALIRARKFGNVSALWAGGAEIDWRQIPVSAEARRISLPTYSFQRSRYWVPTKAESGRTLADGSGHKPLHPLIDRNESTMEGVSYAKTLSASEWFLDEHRLRGKPVFPGACCVEMARAAFSLFTGSRTAVLRNIVWPQVLTVESAVEIALKLKQSGDAWSFAIEAKDSGKVCAQGNVEAFATPALRESSLNFNLGDLQRAMSELHDLSAFDSHFRNAGLEYGNNFRVIRKAFIGNGRALVRLSGTGGQQGDFKGKYGLHPALLDGAFQALALVVSDRGSDSLYLPFSVRELRFYKEFSENMWAFVTVTSGAEGNANEIKCNLTICDENGQVAATIEELTIRRAQGATQGGGAIRKSQEVYLYRPVWTSIHGKRGEFFAEGGLSVIIDDVSARAARVRDEILRQCGKSDCEVVILRSGPAWRQENGHQFEMQLDAGKDWTRLFGEWARWKTKSIAVLDLRGLEETGMGNGRGTGSLIDSGEATSGLIENLLRFTQSAIQQNFGSEITYTRVFGEGSYAESAIATAAVGFGKALQRENPRIRVNALSLSSGGQTPSRLASVLINDPTQAGRFARNEESGLRMAFERIVVEEVGETPVSGVGRYLFDTGHVCCITGGCGGVGLVVAKYLARRCRAKIAILGRSPIDETKAAHLEDIRKLGGEALYLQCDVADSESVERAMKSIRAQWGSIRGIIHAAGIVEDSWALRKDVAAMRRVLAPKVRGVLNLDKATRDEPLQYMVLCSSIASVVGNVGQTDYAAANGFLDGFAEVRERLRKSGLRKGRTVSINWPFWSEGGMRIDAEKLAHIERTSGLAPMSSEAGCAALEACLRQDSAQVVVAVGDRSRIDSLLGVEQTTASVSEAARALPKSSNAGIDSVNRNVREILCRAVSFVLKVNTNDIDFSANWEEFGFDSVKLTEFANYLQEELRTEIAPADLFEHPSLSRLQTFLVNHRRADMERLLDSAPSGEAVAADGSKVKALLETSGATESRQDAGTVANGPTAPRQISEPIAIVGIAGVFPQCPDLDSFWAALAQGRDLITEIPPDRFDWQKYFGDPLVEPGKTNSRWGGFMREIDAFDNGFFKISPQEAGLMDPQHRIILELAWTAIEEAGYAPGSLQGSRTGVFVAQGNRDYAEAMAEAGVAAAAQYATGIAPNMLSNRISHILDLRGPSETIDTACSSSLVAIHRAVAALRSNECDLALAGGINVILTPAAFVSFSEGGLLSPDGRCKTFDREANGYVRGEGGGVVALKRLAQAVADGDHIHGVIRAIAINHGGKGGSLTAPNPEAQAELYSRTLSESGLDFSDIDCIETHGTGTALGDAVEIRGLKLAFAKTGASAGDWHKCALGTVKSNIGHLEPAAGVAGLIKMLLALRNESLPATLHVKTVNPKIQLDGTPFQILTEAKPWPSAARSNFPGKPRRAGISSFGFGGVNAHLILEEFHKSPSEFTKDKTPQLIVLSARDEERLLESALRLRHWLGKQTLSGTEAPSLSDVAFTLQTGRDGMRARIAFVVSELSELKARLDKYIDGPKAFHSEGPGGNGSSDDRQPADSHQLFAGRDWNSLADLWLGGTSIPWAQFYPPGARRRVSLPSYPFARQRNWFTTPPVGNEASAKSAARSVARRAISPSNYWISDHRIQGIPVAPAACLVEMALEIIEGPAGHNLSISDLKWERALRVSQSAEVSLQIARRGEIADWAVHSGDRSDETLFASGTVTFNSGIRPIAPLDLVKLRTSCRQTLGGKKLYEDFSAIGLDYGPSFQVVEEIWAGEREALAKLRLGAQIKPDGQRLPIHPLLLDGAMQSAAALMTGKRALYLPVSIDRIDFYGDVENEALARVTIREHFTNASEKLVVDIVIADATGVAKASISGLVFCAAQRPKRKEIAGIVARDTITPPRQNSSEALDFLRGILADTLKMSPLSIDGGTTFEKLGINSILILKLNALLELKLGPLSATLFYEHNDIASLANHLTEKFPKVFGLSAEKNGEIGKVATIPTVAQFDKTEDDQKPILARQQTSDDAIAIVGIHGRFPMARNLEEFWKNLIEGRDCITEVPQDRWDFRKFFDSEKGAPGKSYLKWGGFLDDADKFDPLFFKISPREAELMDPQERLFLESAWAAVEDAGYSASALASSLRHEVGVFVGAMFGTYQLYGPEEHLKGNPVIPNSSYWSIANRVSYCMDFRGPSMAVDTACSSSLYAIHLACESVRAGECRAAIAGGVNLSLHPYKYIALSQGRFASSDGRCRSFGEGGDGYVPGEGVGAVLLKRLSDAIADNDHVYGIIRGSSVNHGGKTSGYTVPNPNAQADLIQRALERAAVRPEQITSIEAHGTGTLLGDPIEITALARVWSGVPRDYTCSIGSVKSNIGHLESAAGIAALAKVILQFKHERIAPTLHCDHPNPNIDFERTPFRLAREPVAWKSKNGSRRIAAISSFGAGGSNAHLIIEEFISEVEKPSTSDTRSEQEELIVLSAIDEARLRDYALNVRRFLDHVSGDQSLETDGHHSNDVSGNGARNPVELPPLCLSDLAFTLQQGREMMPVRLAIIAKSLKEVHDRLAAWLEGTADDLNILASGKSIKNASSVLQQSPETEAYLAALRNGKKLRQIASIWTAGTDIDWSKLRVSEGGRRVALPTYPFARERCWISRRSDVPRVASSPATEKQTSNGVAHGEEDVTRSHHDDEPSIAPIDEHKSESNGSSHQIEHQQAFAPAAVESTLSRIRMIFSEHLKIEPHRLAEDMPFEEFGVDSVLLAELVQQIEAIIDDHLDPAILLEHSTLGELAKFLESHYKQFSPKPPMSLSASAPVSQVSAQTNARKSAAEGPVHKTNNAIENGKTLGSQNREIAVIGYWCHFPGAPNPEIFWRNLRAGVNSVREVPPERWDIAEFYEQTPRASRSYGKWGGFLDRIEWFDPGYFNIPETEAAAVDPLVRQFLEVGTQALRHAGYSREEISGRRVGVFAGARVANFASKLDKYHKNAFAGVGQNFIASYLSHFCDLKGPSLVVDSACSSSLLAIHLAAQSLLSGESEMAVAGGVEILLDEHPYLLLSAGKALSPDGRCHTFDAKANGIVPGEGCGAVILKRLDQALLDGDRIYGVLEVSTANNDGHTMGVITPNLEAQKDAVQTSLQKSGINPRTITYLETHGTGTMIGDPIELKGLTQVFGSFTPDTRFCAVGSVKTNFGHLLSAAGVASFLKVILALQHRELPPTLHCETPNPRFDFGRSPFYPVTTLKPWPGADSILRAGINSFGFGGTNVHAILRNAPVLSSSSRKPLPPAEFNRKRYWPEAPRKIANSVNETQGKSELRQSQLEPAEIKETSINRLTFLDLEEEKA